MICLGLRETAGPSASVGGCDFLISLIVLVAGKL
jgi:hypothetical protein